MDTYRLQLFQYAAYYKSFSKAAEICNITQVTMSRQMKHLEDEIGTQLFLRNSQGVKLTTAGEILLEASVNVLNVVNNVIDDCRNCENRPFSPLKIAVGIYEWVYLQEPLSLFKEKFPSAEYVINCQTYKYMASTLLDGSFDLGLSEEEVAKKTQLSYCELKKEKYCVAANRNSKFWLLSDILQGQLFNQKVITLLPNEYDSVRRYCKTHHLPVQSYIEANFMNSMTLYLQTDAGIALLPETICKTLPDSIIFKDCLAHPLTASFGIVYNEGNTNAAIAQFIEICQSCYTK